VIIPAEIVGSPTALPARSHPGVVPAVLRFLAEQLRLEAEDVIEDTVDPATLEAMVGDHAGVLELAPEGGPERAVDPALTANLSLLEQLKADIKCELLGPVGRHVHAVPSTSTLPWSVTRACTLLSASSEYWTAG
jgi:hypothetical protein